MMGHTFKGRTPKGRLGTGPWHTCRVCLDPVHKNKLAPVGGDIVCDNCYEKEET